MDFPPIPGELLVDIFLLLPDPADLVRASAACISFRRLVADRRFLRLYRKLHAPPLLGFIDIPSEFHRASPPHPSASAASAAALAGDFSFSFLPCTGGYWMAQDSRDGRVLLTSVPRERPRRAFFPRGPDDLAATPVEPPVRRQRFCEAFLLPGIEDEDDGAAAVEETSFRVIWMVLHQAKLVCFVFSSSIGQWRPIPPQGWSNLFGSNLLSTTTSPMLALRNYAYGCFYWITNYKEKLLVLDTQRIREFSTADVPPVARNSRGADIAIVEAGEGRPGMFVRASNTSCLKFTIRQQSSGRSSSQWQKEKTISLDSEHDFMGSTGRYLLLYKYGSWHDAGCFSLDVKTFHLERINASRPAIAYTHTYSNFPPSLLSSPTVSGGTLWLSPNFHSYRTCRMLDSSLL